MAVMERVGNISLEKKSAGRISFLLICIYWSEERNDRTGQFNPNRMVEGFI